ncbi:MAG: hypothetical protein Q9190_004843 [Brigantiaea leucoxantha]
MSSNGTTQSSQNGDSSKPPQKPLHELLTPTLVDIYVGEENTHYPLHEKLLCYHSPFFARIFYGKTSSSSRTKEFGLPDYDDRTFCLLIGWLYSRSLPPAPASEPEIGPLLDLYLLAQKLEVEGLCAEVVDVVREFYHREGTYPGLRRVQYVYANTEADNLMREMMVGSVARGLVLGRQIPSHWAKALKGNGQLGVDIIRSIQEWGLDGEVVPDVRDVSVDRERGRGWEGKAVGFSAVVEEGGSEIKKEESDLESTGINGNGIH